MNTSLRIVLITGVNKGIGFEIARQLGKVRHRVLQGARDVALGEAAAASLKGEGIPLTRHRVFRRRLPTNATAAHFGPSSSRTVLRFV